MFRAFLTTIGILFIWAIVDVVIFTTLQLPMDTSIAISLIPLLLTSIWAGFDARKIEFKKYKTSLGSTIYGGGGVFAGVLLLWIIFFPWYLYSRDKILSGRAELKDKYKGEIIKESDITREDAITVMKSRRKKSNSGWWGLGVITVGLIFFFLFFRILILPGDFIVTAKKHPTFSNTFVDFEDFVKRSNKAAKEHLIEDAIATSIGLGGGSSLETHLRRHAIDPALYEELWEKGLIVPKKEDDNPK